MGALFQKRKVQKIFLPFNVSLKTLSVRAFPYTHRATCRLPRHLPRRHRINSKDGGLRPGKTGRSVAKFKLISKNSIMLI